ncbi:MAG: type IVB secretion system protein IcmH/DotU [Acidobacteria bacterium]|nr:type IVB secretion system protein IcmH/DotU [Acidobacteriota bacterium]
MAESLTTPTLAELSDDILLLVLNFRERSDSMDFNTLHGGFLTLFEDFGRKAKAHKFEPENINDARFALAAFVDEAVLRSHWPGKEQWADNPLQLQLFETYVAGEIFFEKLEAIRTRGEPAVEVLEIYYLCLTLGFEGKYGIEGSERLAALAKMLHDELGRFRPMNPEGVSPHWKVVDGPAHESSRVPRWLLYSSAAVIAACILIYLVFFIGIRSAAGDLQHDRNAQIFIPTKFKAYGRATPGGPAVAANVDDRSAPGSGSESLSVSVSGGLHICLKRQYPCFEIDTDTGPRLAGQAETTPYRRDRLPKTNEIIRFILC